MLSSTSVYSALVIITLKFEGIDIVVNQAAFIGAPFLLGFLMPEVFASDLRRGNDSLRVEWRLSVQVN